MSIATNSSFNQLAGKAKRAWIPPRIHILTIDLAEGATIGSKCDKHGSLSATAGNDKCTSSEK